VKNLQKNLNSIIILIAAIAAFTFTFSNGTSFAAADAAANNTSPAIERSTQAVADLDKKDKKAAQQDAKKLGQLSSTGNPTERSTGNQTEGTGDIPIEKRGMKYNLFKFCTGMLGVLISSLTIFFCLKLYKKFFLKNKSNQENIDYDKTLESPKDFKEAINLFLDKTDKK